MAENILQDSFGRVIRDLRIAVTDRCDFHCVYCAPIDITGRIQREESLTDGELLLIARAAASLGINKIRITGGEPLVRKGIEKLVRNLSEIESVHDLVLTTNGFGLRDKAQNLKQAGLKRITISCDSLRPERFKEITGRDGLATVLDGVRSVVEAGFPRPKINCVIIRGINDDEPRDFAQFARKHNVCVRFIEFMPFDSAHHWDQNRLVNGSDILDGIQERFKLTPVDFHADGETAIRFSFADGAPGEIGIIAPVSSPFCMKCKRLRLTADGRLRTCLFSTHEHNIRPLINRGAPFEEITEFIRAVVKQKEEGHLINKPAFIQPARPMLHIGG